MVWAILHPQGSVLVNGVVAAPPSHVHVWAEGCPKQPVIGYVFCDQKWTFLVTKGGGVAGVRAGPTEEAWGVHCTCACIRWDMTQSLP